MSAEGGGEDVVIIRYRGMEIICGIDNWQESDGTFEREIPLEVKQQGILQALRVILDVPELESILSVAVQRMRNLRGPKPWLTQRTSPQEMLTSSSSGTAEPTRPGSSEPFRPEP